jgi:hypothetical protein
MASLQLRPGDLPVQWPGQILRALKGPSAKAP